jgi:2-C-methyl-D-erythritol 4-phosphate cytidylyltransferase
MQTPQGGLMAEFLEAYEQLARDGRQVTDDLAAIEALGGSAYLVPGEYTNIKMTTPEDLVIGEALAGSGF